MPCLTLAPTQKMFASSLANEIVAKATETGLSVEELISRISSHAGKITSSGMITKQMMPNDIFEELNQTKALYESAIATIAEMNATIIIILDEANQSNNEITSGPVTTAMLDESILKYLKPEITKLMTEPNFVEGENVKISVTAEGKFLTFAVAKRWYRHTWRD